MKRLIGDRHGLSLPEKNQNCTKGEPEKVYIKAPDYEDVAARLGL